MQPVMKAKIEVNGLPFEATEKHWHGEYTEYEIHQLMHLVDREVLSTAGRKGFIDDVDSYTGQPYLIWEGRTTCSAAHWFDFTIVPESSNTLSLGERTGLRCKTCGQVWDFD